MITISVPVEDLLKDDTVEPNLENVSEAMEKLALELKGFFKENQDFVLDVDYSNVPLEAGPDTTAAEIRGFYFGYKHGILSTKYPT